MSPDQFTLITQQSQGQYRQLMSDKADRILQAITDLTEEIGESGKVVLRISHTAVIDVSTGTITDKLAFGVRDTSSLVCKMIDPDQPSLFDGDTAERAPVEGDDE